MRGCVLCISCYDEIKALIEGIKEADTSLVPNVILQDKKIDLFGYC